MKAIYFVALALVLSGSYGVCYPALAVLHPMLVNPRITGCLGPPVGKYECSASVQYSADGVVMVDITPVAPPVGYERKLVAYGIHCANGDGPSRQEFTGCSFSMAQHAPGLAGECSLAGVYSWELTPRSTCSIFPNWGNHTGAGVGGECVLFAQKGQDVGGPTLHTIYGTVNANVLANSGDSFCQKPLPPSVECSLDLPAVIDHGSVSTSAVSTASIEGRVACGSRPVVSIVGGGQLDMGPGLSSSLSPTMVGDGVLRITSSLRAVNADPGAHQASAIVRVSPY